MTEIRHISDREMALERENARLVDKTERQAATIHVQAVAIQSLQADALRYRWWCAALEAADMDYLEDVFKCIPQNAPIKKQDLDAAINAAMKESK